MATEGDRSRAILAMVAARASREPTFRKKLMSSPAATLKAEGMTPQKGVKWKVLLDTKAVKYVALGRDFRVDPEHAPRLLAVAQRLVPLPEGAELRLVQSTDTTRYLVVPMLPKDLKPGELSDEELMAVTGGWGHHGHGVQSVRYATSEAVAAESTEAAVTQTTEAQDAETTSTVAAEAEVVAVGAAVLT
jgi:hypothetical protein